MNWVTLQAAMVAWVRNASGLVTIWADQNGPRPDAPYMLLTELTHTGIGIDWYDVKDTVSPAPGEEVTFTLRGVREMVLNIQCFGGAAQGDLSPRAYLETVRAKSRLPSIRTPLRTANIGVLTFGSILSVSAPLDVTVYEPRASLDVTLSLAQELTETGTSIDSVEIGNLITDDTLNIPE